MSVDGLKNKVREIMSKVSIDDVDKYIELKKVIIYFVGIKLICNKYSVDIETASKIVGINKKNEQLYSDNSSFDENDKDKLSEILCSLYNECGNISVGKLYENFISAKEQKYLGQVYTPDFIIDEMINISIKPEAIVNNPSYKIIDPACGAGFFLIKIFDKLKEIFVTNRPDIEKKHPQMIDEIYTDLDKFIIENCLWGADIDKFAVFLTRTDLLLKYQNCNKLIKTNIYNKDILLDNDTMLIDLIQDDKSIIDNNSFDLVIGNPPYIGHKKLSILYKKQLKEKFPKIFTDKSDISYCFFKIGYDLLKDGQNLTYITSRYFIEAPSAINLRKFIHSEFDIKKIIDFYGHKVFKQVGVSPAIINCVKSKQNSLTSDIFRLGDNSNFKIKNINQFPYDIFYNYTVDSNNFSVQKWVLLSNEEKKIYNKIDKQGDYVLKNLCNSYQGIITGCDRAFIVNKQQISQFNLETDIILPWIKNSDVTRYKQVKPSKYIIYSDKIIDIKKYPNAIKYIEKYKDRLLSRRECKKNIRKWYELQWGRNLEVFLQQKIIFPYKCKNNRFTIDDIGTLSSADVYSITNNNICSIYYLLGMLNSNLFEYYFKCVAKKLGVNVYDYYPNKIMNLKIRVAWEKDIENCVKELIKINNNSIANNQNKMRAIELEMKMNDIFFKMYKLNDKEIKIIKKFIQ
ncbi:Eco57I restriction-modification methylase domain-containing protein [Abyssisolibacter fermentans]|uniref:Eco57I restriction-modification methylase domain-containing protein n=1 Tax=Abyssisolibacter fermentans TaxID=1766203 RepID=UPI000837352F|nr:N-6 DNA methylase [Abyssisolibacter fermentans]